MKKHITTLTLEVEVEVEYCYVPEERQTMTHPGYDEVIEIQSVMVTHPHTKAREIHDHITDLIREDIEQEARECAIDAGSNERDMDYAEDLGRER